MMTPLVYPRPHGMVETLRGIDFSFVFSNSFRGASFALCLCHPAVVLPVLTCGTYCVHQAAETLEVQSIGQRVVTAATLSEAQSM